MADVRADEKRAGRFRWAWMLLAVLMTAGFLYWLAVASEPTDLRATTEEVPAEAEGGAVPAAGAALTVAAGEFAADPERYLGQAVRVEGVPVANLMNTGLFWVELPEGPQYLVRVAPTAALPDNQIEVGDTLAIAGTVYETTDSVITAWLEAGVLEGRDQAAVARFATTFLEAIRIESAQLAAPETSANGAAGQAGA